jgi:hypothetical protein
MPPPEIAPVTASEPPAKEPAVMTPGVVMFPEASIVAVFAVIVPEGASSTEAAPLLAITVPSEARFREADPVVIVIPSDPFRVVLPELPTVNVTLSLDIMISPVFKIFIWQVTAPEEFLEYKMVSPGVA